jgi:hypothetical protein
MFYHVVVTHVLIQQKLGMHIVQGILKHVLTGIYMAARRCWER